MPVKRGEIYFVDLNLVRGREQAGNRPVLVLSIEAINKLPLVVTVVVGTKGERVPKDYPTKCSYLSGRKWLADGNGLSMLPD
jgi:mRNA interferase MazF